MKIAEEILREPDYDEERIAKLRQERMIIK